jgi:hypothetical protein
MIDRLNRFGVLLDVLCLAAAMFPALSARRRLAWSMRVGPGVLARGFWRPVRRGPSPREPPRRRDVEAAVFMLRSMSRRAQLDRAMASHRWFSWAA